MYRSLLMLLLAIFTVNCSSQHAFARRGIPIPIVWGQGEKLTEMGNLPREVAQSVSEELGTDVTVAFLNERCHLFFLDIWTWNGRHVVHSGDKYWVPDEATWQQMLGRTPQAEYGIPILFRVPLFPIVFGLGVVLYALGTRYQNDTGEMSALTDELIGLLTDERYQRAIQAVFDNQASDGTSKVITSVDEERFAFARQQLVLEGMHPQIVETNLRKLTDAVLADTNREIESHLDVASQLDQAGEWEKSASLYSQLSGILPEQDDRYDYIRRCLDAVNAKLSDPHSIEAIDSSIPSGSAKTQRI